MQEEQYEDGESYSFSYAKDKLTFKDIILQHLKQIGKYASVEWHGGFWENKVKFFGNASVEERYYVPDSREVYSNAVHYLGDTLYPHFDPEMKKAFDEAEEKIKKSFMVNTKPINDEKTEEEVEGSERIRKFPRAIDRQNYRAEKREICRKLFRDLCCFLYRKKYLEIGSIED